MKRRRARVFEEAAEDLRAMIENGDIKPGDQLPPENELSDRYQIGRSSVRETIRILEADGLVEILHGKGTFVTSRDSWRTSRDSVIRLIKENEKELLFLLEAREGLEGMATFLAAQNPTQELVHDLNHILKEMEELADGNEEEINFEEMAKLNTKFHLAISQASGNPLIHKLCVHLLGRFTESNEAILYTGLTVQVQVQEHRQIIEAIEGKNPLIAEKIMRNHIDRVRKEIRYMTVNETSELGKEEFHPN